MSIVLLLFFALILSSVRKPLKFNRDYLSVEQTHTINGIFIIFVFLRHFWQYVDKINSIDTVFDSVNSFLGQTIVTTFMFYSGYGVTVSIWKKREPYLRRFPVDRILKTMILFDIAILFYCILAIFTDEEITVGKVLLSFIGLKSIGNSSWYIFAILCMYLVSYISFSVFIRFEGRKGLFLSLSAATLLTLVYMLTARKYLSGQYYNTVLCYVLGMWWFGFKEKADKLLEKDGFRLAAVLITGGLYFAAHFGSHINIMIDQMQYVFFVVWIVLLTASFRTESRVFKLLGENLLGVYILQRLPMIYFSEISAVHDNTYIYFILCLIVTLALSYIYSVLVMKNVGRLFLIGKKEKKDEYSCNIRRRKRYENERKGQT